MLCAIVSKSGSKGPRNFLRLIQILGSAAGERKFHNPFDIASVTNKSERTRLH